jgi:tRNA (guanine10-N2)-methyltransferase
VRIIIIVIIIIFNLLQSNPDTNPLHLYLYPRSFLIQSLTGETKLPRTMPYELDEVIQDLIAFAAVYLVPGGRLVYWLPTVTEDYSITDMPQHPRLRMVENCEQQFYNWSRRLITMEKLRPEEPDLDLSGMRIAKAEAGDSVSGEQKHGTGSVPAHSKFREAYFKIDAKSEAKAKK